MPSINYYALLGVTQNASMEEIKRAFRAAVLSIHPDHNPNSPSASECTRQLVDAYKILSNPVSRRVYDSSLNTVSAAYTIPKQRSGSSILSRAVGAVSRGIVSLLLVSMMAITVVFLSDWIVDDLDAVVSNWSQNIGRIERTERVIIYLVPESMPADGATISGDNSLESKNSACGNCSSFIKYR